MNQTTVDPFCGQGLYSLHSIYSQFHGFVSLIVCAFGSVANVLNIIVLTRKDMVSPTNVVLTGLAVADLLVLVEYMPFACHMYLRPKRYSLKDKYSYGWALFVLLHSNFSQVFHTISIWLTVTLAVWRYIAVAYPARNRVWCRMETTYAVVATGYVVCPLLCIPVYLCFNIIPVNELLDQNGRRITNGTISGTGTGTNVTGPGTNTTLYFVNLSNIAKARNNLLSNLNFLIYSVVFKIIPCIALTILSLRLVCALVETKKRRQKLTTAITRKTAKNIEKEKQTDRTTRMLLAVLILFLVTEFPQGILGLLSIMFREKFFKDCYQNLGEVVDILALINSAINFILYYMMSRQFRTTFKSLFHSKSLFPPTPRQHKILDETNNHTTTQVTQV